VVAGANIKRAATSEEINFLFQIDAIVARAKNSVVVRLDAVIAALDYLKSTQLLRTALLTLVNLPSYVCLPTNPAAPAAASTSLEGITPPPLNPKP
jgi:hypothetical protein